MPHAPSASSTPQPPPLSLSGGGYGGGYGRRRYGRFGGGYGESRQCPCSLLHVIPSYPILSYLPDPRLPARGSRLAAPRCGWCCRIAYAVRTSTFTHCPHASKHARTHARMRAHVSTTPPDLNAPPPIPNLKRPTTNHQSLISFRRWIRWLWKPLRHGLWRLRHGRHGRVSARGEVWCGVRAWRSVA